MQTVVYDRCDPASPPAVGDAMTNQPYTRILQNVRGLMLAVMPLAATSPPATAQIAKSPPPTGASVHRMVPGARYGAGGFSRWLLGDDYRDLWLTEIEAPVLNLDSVGGGLTPLRTGGFGQSVSLHFTGRDGRRYVVRSVDKDPTKRLIEQLKNTFVEDIIQDQISALHPTGALVVDPLLEATGILHTTHRLVIIPDDPRLGEFREEFAGMLGMLLLHPDEGADDTPGFAGSRRISGSETVFDLLEESPCDRVDARVFLKARLVDMLIGDKDRHAGQWRWASYSRGECRLWRPIPEDRDQAFVDFDGLVMWLTRRVRPQQIKFEPQYPSVTGLTFNGWEVDRELLAELEKPVWDSLVATVQREITDQVVDAAVLRLPEPHYGLSGGHIAAALKSRRDNLASFAERYYRLVAERPDIWATDEAEWAQLTHHDNGDLVLLIGPEEDSERATPYYRRTFHSDETREVRLYMRGGDDRVEILGSLGQITIRVDGGAGDDQLVNSSQAGASKTRFYDSRGDNRFETGPGAKIDRREWERPPAKDQAHRHALDWGGRSLSYPLFAYAPDPGFFLAMSFSRENYGYRKDPFATRHSLTAGLVTNGPEPIVAYSGIFRHLRPGVDGRLRLHYTGLDFIKFYGFGNETEAPGSVTFYELEERDALVQPTLAFQLGSNRGGKEGAGTESLRPSVSIEFGPILRYFDTPLDENASRFLGTLDPSPYGAGEFGQLGALAAVEVDTRDNAGNAKKGVHLSITGTVYPAIWDVESTFGSVEGTASTYVTAPVPGDPTLALRVGGRQVWGDYPFQEAAYLGGGRMLRGFRSRRYAGDAAVYGNAELRFAVAPFKILVPGTVGFFGLADIGRVFYEDDPATVDSWHSGLGGGIWLSFINRMQTLTIGVANGEDLTGLYIRAGFLY
jgi:hypothetical protein